MANEIQFPYISGRIVAARVFDGSTLSDEIILTEIASTGIYTNGGSLSLTAGTEYTVLAFDDGVLVGQSSLLMWTGSDFASKTQAAALETWRRQGLDVSSPVTRSKSGDNVIETFSGVTLTHSVTGESVTVQRS